MNTDPKPQTRQSDYNKQARSHQEEALDDALKNTFPASDLVSIEQPVPPAADHDREDLTECLRQRSEGLMRKAALVHEC